jgi:hypothetical protein
MVMALHVLMTIALANPSVQRKYEVRRGEWYQYQFDERACSELPISRGWELPDSVPLSWRKGLRALFLGIHGLEYRGMLDESGRIAAAAKGDYGGGSPYMLSPKKYAFTLRVPSELSSIRDAEWNAAKPIRIPLENSSGTARPQRAGTFCITKGEHTALDGRECGKSTRHPI